MFTNNVVTNLCDFSVSQQPFVLKNDWGLFTSIVLGLGLGKFTYVLGIIGVSKHECNPATWPSKVACWGLILISKRLITRVMEVMLGKGKFLIWKSWKDKIKTS